VDRKQSMNAAIYARVSTEKQSVDMQLPDLRRYAERMGWPAPVEYLEKESSVKRRPVFERMIADARVGKFDVVLVWRIDRFARSIKQFVDTTVELAAHRVRLISVSENVDTGDESPFGEFTVKLLALLAELERKIIVSRVKAGVAEAKRKGIHCGRPKRVFRRDEAERMRKTGMSWRAIATALGVPQSTVRLALNGVQKV
jgi:DNA invertase Pin-like site-specific DNA recombinase